MQNIVLESITFFTFAPHANRAKSQNTSSSDHGIRGRCALLNQQQRGTSTIDIEKDRESIDEFVDRVSNAVVTMYLNDHPEILKG